MSGFGFTITKGRQIDFDANDHTLSEFLLSREPTFALCIACGCCTATCTAGSHTDFSLRRINIALKRGEVDLVRREIDRCMLCGKCTMLCPMGVNTRNVVYTLRKQIKMLDGYAF
ncbi:MAG: 4Fe-4S dicluster domain-containing protein [Bacteroidales bacterium]|jgi:heterodisulfide reductase subunit C|nr:4Fe-4S dicluster domain-containing protein [Bacteroidales bacterium]